MPIHVSYFAADLSGPYELGEVNYGEPPICIPTYEEGNAHYIIVRCLAGDIGGVVHLLGKDVVETAERTAKDIVAIPERHFNDQTRVAAIHGNEHELTAYDYDKSQVMLVIKHVGEMAARMSRN